MSISKRLTTAIAFLRDSSLVFFFYLLHALFDVLQGSSQFFIYSQSFIFILPFETEFVCYFLVIIFQNLNALPKELYTFFKFQRVLVPVPIIVFWVQVSKVQGRHTLLCGLACDNFPQIELGLLIDLDLKVFSALQFNLLFGFY